MVLVALLTALVVAQKPAQASDAIVIEWKADTLTTPPPEKLGSYTMAPFAPDSRPLFEDVSTVPAPEGGILQFDEPMSHRRVGFDTGWNTEWGHGYTGDVYFNGYGRTQVVITLPANTKAFYLHAQPNNYGTHNVTATAQDGTTSGPVPVTTNHPNSSSSAGYFGFYATDGSTLSTIKVELDSESYGFAVGEFGISYGVSYLFRGFFRPVDNLPTLNLVKAGRAVPVKFSLGGDEGLDVFADGYPKSRRISCSSSAPLDTVEQTTSAAGGSGLTYDPTTERYTYVWKTRKAWSGTCRQLVVKLDDGSVYRANFKLR
jgi:hypothetical protein